MTKVRLRRLFAVAVSCGALVVGAAPAALAVGASPRAASSESVVSASDAPAGEVVGASEDNGGGTFTVGQRETDADVAARRAARVHAFTPGNNLCTGAWTHAVSTVQFQRASGGTLSWSFFFSAQSRAFLGPVATVTMPYAYVNGTAINPPYGPHAEATTYNFHGSLNRYQYIGGGGGTIQTGNRVTLYWYAQGSIQGRAVDRYITCQVPQPGSA